MSGTQITAAQRALLTDALVNPKPFYAEGIWSFPNDQLNVFLAKEPCRISLSRDAASQEDLQKLAAACDPATFGVDQSDVLDESYRKAGKLDRKDFAINLDVVGSGLLKVVHNSLFGWEDEPRDIRAELYKLNVYGPESFFKAHKDTPRGEDMFGSLVLNFPTKHDGGALVLRHDGREVTHDASKAGYTSPDQVSWVAFYSDVEHEVLPVASGNRVTITYNLYFTGETAIATSLPSVEPLLAAFKEVLKHETFLSAGGRLGFGLTHQYPMPTDIEGKKNKKVFQGLSNVLKGSDRALFCAAQAAGLQPKLAVTYELEYAGTYLLDYVYQGGGGDYEVGWAEEMKWAKAEKIEDCDDENADSSDGEQTRQQGANKTKGAPKVEWIVPRKSNTRVKMHFIAYGNEASIGSTYGDVVLIATVPAKEQRTL